MKMTLAKRRRFYGVMVSTQDFESCDPSSTLGRTSYVNDEARTLMEYHYIHYIDRPILAIWCQSINVSITPEGSEVQLLNRHLHDLPPKS